MPLVSGNHRTWIDLSSISPNPQLYVFGPGQNEGKGKSESEGKKGKKQKSDLTDTYNTYLKLPTQVSDDLRPSKQAAQCKYPYHCLPTLPNEYIYCLWKWSEYLEWNE